MNSHGNSDNLDLLIADLDLLQAELQKDIEEIDRLLAPPTQNVPTQNVSTQNVSTQTARVSDAMWDILITVPNHTFVPTARVSDATWDILTTVPNHTFVPPYPPRVNPPIQHFFMRDALLGSPLEAQLNAQLEDAVAALVADLRALAPRSVSPTNVNVIGDDMEEVD
jgi:hypothetical protein